MKVLFISSPHPDWQQYMVYIGLVRELGVENVVDWPFWCRYHGEDRTFQARADIPLGQLCRSWSEITSGGAVGTHQSAYLPQMTEMVPAREWSFEEVVKRIHEFDLVVLGSVRSHSSTALWELIKVVGREALRRIAIVDGEDYTEIRWDFVREFNPFVYFKRECIENPYEPFPAERARLASTVRVRPLQFSGLIPETPPVPKTVDVSLLGGNHDHERSTFVQKMRAAFGDQFFESGNLLFSTYQEMINCSKIVLSLRGWGNAQDPVRLYEFHSFPTFIVGARSTILRPNPFVDGVHCRYYDSPDHAVEIVRQYLRPEAEAERLKIAAAGNQLLRQHHTCQARARQLLQEATA